MVGMRFFWILPAPIHLRVPRFVWGRENQVSAPWLLGDVEATKLQDEGDKLAWSMQAKQN